MQTPSRYSATDDAPRLSRTAWRLFAPALLACLFHFACAPDARAQQSTLGLPRADTAGAGDHSKQSPGREEMLRNLEVKRRENAYKENIERAKEGAQIGAELRQSYERTKSFGSAEQKKLGRLEKLARSIREQAGGDDDKEGVKDLPASPAESFAELEKISGELQSKVENTPRHVVSTGVINTSNRLLGLIRHIRSSLK
jgi:hypothetical protein